MYVVCTFDATLFYYGESECLEYYSNRVPVVVLVVGGFTRSTFDLRRQQQRFWARLDYNRYVTSHD